MLQRLTGHRLTFAILGGIITLSAVILWIAPAERTLGEGVKLVFIHGALLLAGLLGIYAAGLVGVAVAISGREDIQNWSQTIGWVGFGMYAAGLLMSIPASVANWGGLFMIEPRMRVALMGMAAMVIVLVGNLMLTHVRMKGILSLALAAYLAYSIYTAPLVLHPQNPIGTSTSRAIQVSFLALLILCVGAAGWIVWRTRSTVEAKQE